MHWMLSDRADRRALPLADRHYNRQKIGSPQFVPPGRCVVLRDQWKPVAERGWRETLGSNVPAKVVKALGNKGAK